MGYTVRLRKEAAMKKHILLVIYFVSLSLISFGIWRLLMALASPQITELGLW